MSKILRTKREKSGEKMNSFSQEGEGMKKINEVKTYPVPFPLEEVKKNISITKKTSSKPSKEQIINQAFQIHSQGNILEAAKLYQYFINQGFTDHRVFSNYGTILKNLGKSQEAELSYRKAIEIKPDYAISHYNLGVLFNDLGKLQEAVLSYRKAIEIKPDYAVYHYNLGVLLNNLGRLQEAELSYRKAIKIKPDYAAPYSNLGNILKDLGKSKEAELSYRKAIKLNPDFADAHANLGSILSDLGKLQEAKNEWAKAIELDPNLTITIEQLAWRLYYEKEYELAIKYLLKVKSDKGQSLHLGCLLSLDREKDFDQKYKELSENGVCDAGMGGIVEHSNFLYGTNKESHFCNKAINYILVEKINEESFSEHDLSELIAYIHKEKTTMRSQGSLKGGVQTSGDLFTLNLPFIKSVKKAIEDKIEIYKNKFKDSGQGFINNWPDKYELKSWMICMKSGGFLIPHNHEYGWITGSFYLQMPKINGNDEAGNIAFSYQGPNFPNKGKNFDLTIKKIETRDIFIFPSSLFHHTIPFESSEERICFVFDLVQK